MCVTSVAIYEKPSQPIFKAEPTRNDNNKLGDSDNDSGPSGMETYQAAGQFSPCASPAGADDNYDDPKTDADYNPLTDDDNHNSPAASSPNVSKSDSDPEWETPKKSRKRSGQKITSKPAKRQKKTNKVKSVAIYKKPPPPKLLAVDGNSTHDSYSQYLDTSLFTYPPVTASDFAAIPKICQPSKEYEEGQCRVHENGFFCPSCKKQFITKYFAISHIQRCHLAIYRPWRCPHCSRRTKILATLQSHLDAHEKGIMLSCSICKNFCCQSKNQLDIHVITHFKYLPTRQCPECPENDFPRFLNFTTHMTQQHNYNWYPKFQQRDFKCQPCARNLKTPRGLEYHNIIKHGQVDTSGKFPVCPECGLVQYSEKTLEEHTITKHPKGAFICEHCGISCKSEFHLDHHLKVNHEMAPELCKLCELPLRGPDQKRHHWTKNHKEAEGMSDEALQEYKTKMWTELNHSCKRCGEKFAFRVQIYHHERQVHKEYFEKFRCNICSKGFGQLNSLKRHRESQHEGFEVKCDFCNRSFSLVSGLRQHLKFYCKEMGEHRKGLFLNNPHLKCDICGYAGNTILSVDYHKLIKHGVMDTEGKFPVCADCGKQCMSETTLKAHIKAKHPKGKYVCGECGLEWSLESQLEHHYRTYHQFKAEPCLLCGIELRGKQQKTRHMDKEHKEVKGMAEEEIIEYGRRMWETMGWNCGKCGQGFAFEVLLNNHVKEMHQDEVKDNLACDFCGKRFSRRNAVKRHMVTEHEGKRWRCEACGKEWKTGDGLRIHRKSGNCGQEKPRRRRVKRERV